VSKDPLDRKSPRGDWLPVDPQRQAEEEKPLRRVFTNVSMREFDPTWYLAKYPDLRKAYGRNERTATIHYGQVGAREMRSPNAFFDPHYYLSQNHDLAHLDGMHLLDHWYRFGINEGRQAVPWFSIKYYLEHHPDLQKAYGSNYAAAFDHWKGAGHREGRQTAPGVTLRVCWVDRVDSRGLAPLADGSGFVGERVPEEPPIKEEPSTGAIISALSGQWEMGALRFITKHIIGARDTPLPSGGAKVSAPQKGDVIVGHDPIFKGDVNVPGDIRSTC